MEELHSTKAEAQDLVPHHTHDHEHTQGSAESTGRGGW